MSGKATTSSGVSGMFLLGILFVGLKLTGNIDWSWWWVTLPFWGGIALFLSVALLCLLLTAIVSAFDR